MLPPALKTGKLTIVANAMAREVMTDADGLATGVLVRGHANSGPSIRCVRGSWCSQRAAASRRVCC